MQTLRDALRHANDGDGLRIYMRRVEQDQITGAVDGIESKNCQIALVFTAIRFRGMNVASPATRLPKSWRTISPVSVLTFIMVLKVAEGGLVSCSVLVSVGR